MGLKPSYRIIANSQDITDLIKDRLISMRITDEAGLQSDTLEIELADHIPTKRIELPATGAELEVWLGYDDASTRMGLFVVDELQLAINPDRLTISAKASPQDASSSGQSSMVTQKTRSWEAGNTIGTLTETIAAEHGLTPAVATALSGIALPHIDQINESDINLLTRIVRDYDAIAKPAGGSLIVAAKGESKTVSGQDLPTITLRPQQVSSLSVTISKRKPSGTVIAEYRDLASAQDVEVTVGEGEPKKRLRHLYPDKASATKGAEAEHAKGKRAEKMLSCSLPGDPSLIAESRLILEEFRDGINGEWLITRVEHSVDTSGWRSSLTGELPPI